MKYLAILFSLYLIALTLMPCGDVLDSDAGTISSYSVHKDAEGADDCTQESCAPFCSCNCCSIGKHIPVQTVVISVEPSVQVSYALYTILATSQQPIDVWQPPKLA